MSEFSELKERRKGLVASLKDNDFYNGVKNLLTGLYPDKAHFIYELLQNAEDMSATIVKFELYTDKLIFEHNGRKRDFTIGDIAAITNVGSSPKRDDPTQVGEFGVGFKAVYAYTETPEIHSGEYNFKIKDMFIPEDQGVSNNSKQGITRFVFPFDNVDKPMATAYQEIKDGLESLDETSILFLENIKEIEYKFENINYSGGTGKITIRQHQTIDFLYKIERKYSDNTKHVTNWAKFSKPCMVTKTKKGLSEVPVSIAYKMLLNDENKFEMDSNLMGKLCIFFPSDINTGLRFHINAPFASTVARDNIRKCKENVLLLNKLVELMSESVRVLKHENMLDYSVYSTLPTFRDFDQRVVDGVDYSIKNNIDLNYFVFAKEIYHIFTNEQLFVTSDGEYVGIYDVLQTNTLIKSVLPQKYVKKIYSKNWMETVKPITRISYFFEQFPIRNYSAETFLESLEYNNSIFDELFKEHVDELYFKNLYLLLSQANPREKQTLFDGKTRTEILSVVNFLYCTDGKLHSPDESIFLQTDYIPKYIKEYYYLDLHLNNNMNDRNILMFLNDLGIIALSESEDISLGISGSKCNDNIYYWFDILKQYKEDPLTIKNYQNKPVFKAKNIDNGATLTVCAFQCSWSEELAFFSDRKFIFDKEYYKEIKEYFPEMKKIFEKLGGNVKIEFTMDKYSLDDYPLLNLIDRSHERHNTFEWFDGNIQNFKWNKLKSISSENLYSHALLLWNSVLNFDGKEILFNAYYKPNKRADVQINESSLVYYLKRMKWVPCEDGIYRKPCDVNNNILPEDFKYEKASALLDEIQKKSNCAYNELVSKGIKNSILLELSRYSDEELQEMNEVYVKYKEKVNRAQKGIDEIINSSEKEQKNIKDEEDDYGISHKLKNPDKRKIKLEDEYEEIQGRPSEITKKISFSLLRPNTNEKEFMKQQYHSKCQICGNDGILTANGKKYFEAINIFNTAEMDENMIKTLCVSGWNTLSLCPNCAAKYKYCQISFNGLIEQIQNIKVQDQEEIELKIILQNKETTIHFTPKHFLALQTVVNKLKEKDN